MTDYQKSYLDLYNYTIDRMLTRQQSDRERLVKRLTDKRNTPASKQAYIRRYRLRTRQRYNTIRINNEKIQALKNREE